MSAHGQRPGLKSHQRSKALQGRNNTRHSPCVERGLRVSFPPTGLSPPVVIHETRALPWPDLFDAFGVGESTTSRVIQRRDVSATCSHGLPTNCLENRPRAVRPTSGLCPVASVF